MQTVLTIIDPIAKKLTEDFAHLEPVKVVAEKLKVKPGHVVMAGFSLIFLLVISGVASGLLTGIMGFAYPAYMSFKALESPGEDDDKQWLTYWVVFIFVDFFDNVLGIFLTIIPLYHLLKMIFYIYLFYPKTKGALTIYQNFLRPILTKYEKDIDTALDKGKAFAEKIETEGKKKFN